LNDTIMHLSTTTKNKLQRIKYNKVWNQKSTWNPIQISTKVGIQIRGHFPTPSHLQENQHFWAKIKLCIYHCMHT
jgi:hypothetical protein